MLLLLLPFFAKELIVVNDDLIIFSINISLLLTLIYMINLTKIFDNYRQNIQEHLASGFGERKMFFNLLTVIQLNEPTIRFNFVE